MTSPLILASEPSYTDVGALVVAGLALLLSGFSIWFGPWKAKQDSRQLERRQELKVLAGLVGELARHFTILYGVLSSNEGRGSSDKSQLVLAAVGNYNQKEVNDRLLDSTLLLPEYEESLKGSLAHFAQMNSELIPVLKFKRTFEGDLKKSVKNGMEETSAVYHRIREDLRGKK